MIRPVTSADSERICSIYNYYVENTVITFEELSLTVDEMQARIAGISETFPYFVYEHEGEVIGYAYAARFRPREAYRFTVELSIYVDKDRQRQGAGSALMQSLLEELKHRNFHSATGIIALPNEKSVKLHERYGFKKVGHIYEVGYKFGKWIDVGYWQLPLHAEF